jgi:uncharacterized membrane protein
MQSYMLFKTIHLVGVFLIFIGLAGLATHAANGGQKRENAVYGPLTGLHGLGLLLAIVCGFGMWAVVMRTPGSPSAAWLVTKLIVWVLLAVAAVVPYRWPRHARAVLAVGLPLLGAFVAVIAVLKPF